MEPSICSLYKIRHGSLYPHLKHIQYCVFFILHSPQSMLKILPAGKGHTRNSSSFLDFNNKPFASLSFPSHYQNQGTKALCRNRSSYFMFSANHFSIIIFPASTEGLLGPDNSDILMNLSGKKIEYTNI
jgi:hypothetical protein